MEKTQTSGEPSRFSLNVARKEISFGECAHLPPFQVRYLRYNEGWWLKQRAGRGLVDSPRPPIRRDLASNPRPCNLLSAEGGLYHGESLLIPVGEEFPRTRMARVSRRQGYDSMAKTTSSPCVPRLCLRLWLCLYLCLFSSCLSC